MTDEGLGGWDQWYADDLTPWEIGRPQAVWVDLVDAEALRTPILDSGCGTGEHTLLLAERGLEVLGVDLSPIAIDRARRKAERRGVAADFVIGDVLRLQDLGRRFATVIDSAVFHVFDDHDRARYVASLASVVEPGGVVHVLVFSDRVPGDAGPRRVSQAEIRDAFADGWEVERIDDAFFEVRPDWVLWTGRPRSRICAIRHSVIRHDPGIVLLSLPT
jgi:SAM-dependent methyltransferase